MLNRLYPNLSTSAVSDDEENFIDSNDVSVHCDIMSLEYEMNACINNASKEGGVQQTPYKSLKEEFAIYKKTGKRTQTLQQLYDAVLTVRPTSTESERVFSVSEISP